MIFNSGREKSLVISVREKITDSCCKTQTVQIVIVIKSGGVKFNIDMCVFIQFADIKHVGYMCTIISNRIRHSHSDLPGTGKFLDRKRGIFI